MPRKNTSKSKKTIVKKTSKKVKPVSDEEYSYLSSEDDEISDVMSGGETSDDDNEHLDRDPDDEAETSDGPNDENTDGEIDPVSHEELADEDDEEVDEEEYEEADGEYEEVEGEEGEYTGKPTKCHMKNLYSDIFVDEDADIYGKMVYTQTPMNDRETDAIMTYYEMVRIIGTRAQQINLGSKPLLTGLDGLVSVKVAYVELLAKKNPFIIRRHLPGKKYEDWRTDELEMIHEITDDFFLPENFSLTESIKTN